MGKFEIIAKDHGQPVIIAMGERVQVAKEKFDRRFEEKYGDGKKCSKN